MPRPAYRLLEHPADLYVEFRATDDRELFGRAVAVLFDLAVGDYAAPAVREVEISAVGPDQRELLRNWLAEWLYLIAGRGLAAREVELLELDERSARGRGRVIALAELAGPQKMEIKAVTFHGLAIERDARGIAARVLFDI